MADTGEDPRQNWDDPNRFVPRWEIQRMITDAIANYDRIVAEPRVTSLQSCLTSVENLMQQIKGGMMVVKWAAAALGVAGTSATVVYTLQRMGHRI